MKNEKDGVQLAANEIASQWIIGRLFVNGTTERIAAIIRKHCQSGDEMVNERLLKAAKKLQAQAHVFGLRGATNHPAVKCNVQNTTLGDWQELSGAIHAAESAAPSMESEMAEALRMVTGINDDPEKGVMVRLSFAAEAQIKDVLARYDIRSSKNATPASPAKCS